jgi:hypothetical protein
MNRSETQPADALTNPTVDGCWLVDLQAYLGARLAHSRSLGVALPDATPPLAAKKPLQTRHCAVIS